MALSRRLRLARMVLWAHGSWCWFGDPRAVYVGGGQDETFVGWIGWRGQITVGEYASRTGSTSFHVVGRQAPDDHGDPSILVEPDGRLTVFWSGHSGPTMNYRTTVAPYEISRWGPVHHVISQLNGPKGFTYPNPVILSGEHDKLYLFWRGADWSQDFATRSIDGKWSPAQRLIAVPHQRPYVKVASNGTNTIALAFTNGHPRGVVTNIYYAAYRDGSLWTAGGRRIASIDDGPISPQQADLVYDADKTGDPLMGVGRGARFHGPAGDRLCDVPVALAPRLLVRDMDRNAVGLPPDDRRGSDDQPAHDRAAVLGRARARPRQSLDRLPVAEGRRLVRDRTVDDRRRRLITGATRRSCGPGGRTMSGPWCRAERAGRSTCCGCTASTTGTATTGRRSPF